MLLKSKRMKGLHLGSLEVTAKHTHRLDVKVLGHITTSGLLQEY